MSKTIFLSNDLIIDYCNYVLQTHFRLANVFKLIDSKEKSHDLKIKMKSNEKILSLMYTILTESLTLITTFGVEDGTEAMGEVGRQLSNMNTSYEESKSKWNDMFIDKFKQLKECLKSQYNDNSQSMDLDYSASSMMISSYGSFELRQFSYQSKK